MLPRQEIGKHLQQALLAPAAVALVLVAEKSLAVSRLLIHPIPQLLGRLSFPMYLLHWPTLLAFLPFIHSLAAGGQEKSMLSISVSALLYVLITLLACYPFEKLVDLLAIHWGRQLRSAMTF